MLKELHLEIFLQIHSYENSFLLANDPNTTKKLLFFSNNLKTEFFNNSLVWLILIFPSGEKNTKKKR